MPMQEAWRWALLTRHYNRIGRINPMPTPLKLRTAALLLMIVTTTPSFAAGTGMMWQVPNEPTGKFAEAGAPGLCQCINVDNHLATMCLASAVTCRSQCGHMYSYLPDARQSCAPNMMSQARSAR